MPRARALPTATAAQARPSSISSPIKTLQQQHQTKIPLNDDSTEKAARVRSRKALQSQHLAGLKKAATQTRDDDGNNSNAPHTPSQGDQRNHDNGYGDDYGESPAGQYGGVKGNAVTPMKRVPLLANFEEWMKLATDNKINAANSWNFALIDYFYDMTLLKEGDGVNFQKASCTLDGCVKIYTSRVDSVATETGRLLSGLADSSGGAARKRKGGDEEGEDGGPDEDGDGEEGEDGATKKKGRKKAQRWAEATLVQSFEQLRVKKMELEFAVDPLFKKASADFDEGGAKGLLLNHLSIDGTGRIVFDSSDDVQAETEPADEPHQQRRDSLEPEAKTSPDSLVANAGPVGDESQEPEETDSPIDIATLAARFFPDLSILDSQSVCPSMQAFELGAAGADAASLDLPFLKAPDNWRDEHATSPEQEGKDALQSPPANTAFDNDDVDDDGGDGGGAPFFNLSPDDMDAHVGFGEGGEVWAQTAALATQSHPQHFLATNGSDDATTSGEDEAGEVGTFNARAPSYTVALHSTSDAAEKNVLAYFDANKAWAGPEHWKITRLRQTAIAQPAEAASKGRKEKEPFSIDFSAPLTSDLKTLLDTPASSNAVISLPRREWKSRTRNLLPDDRHFASKDLLRLFLKPRAGITSRSRRAGDATSRAGEEVDGDGEVGEAYWASNTAAGATAAARHPMDDDDDDADGQAVKGAYDADFFADDDGRVALPLSDGVDDDDAVPFTDAREAFSPGAAGAAVPGTVGGDGIVAAGGGEGVGLLQPDGAARVGEGDTASMPASQAFGAQLVMQARRSRPEYVQYARVAKKVDVRRLKEEMWRGIDGVAGVGGVEPQSLPSDPTTSSSSTPTTTPLPTESLPSSTSAPLKFTSIMQNLQHAYPPQQLRDISTSYGFICLLHLANEKGLRIDKVEGLDDLVVWRDESALVEGVA